MIIRRPKRERGHLNFGWLDTWHTFSFGSYYDPRHMGVSALRVINDDRILPHTGFDTHGHRNMEILTYMLAGQLTHRDSMGHEEHLSAGECQLMSAGKGLTHSEVNAGNEPVHLLQIWIEPSVRDTEPGYQQRAFPPKPGLTLLASENGAEDSFVVRQSARIWRGQYAASTATITLAESTTYWLQLIRGAIESDDSSLEPGDGAEIREQAQLTMRFPEDTEFLLFELP